MLTSVGEALRYYVKIGEFVMKTIYVCLGLVEKYQLKGLSQTLTFSDKLKPRQN